MTEEEAVYIEPLNLTSKLSRHTKGFMFSLGILVVSASAATVGTIIDQWIIMTLGYVIAGISSVSYLIFFILFIVNIKKFGRIDNQFLSLSNWIFTSFLYAFIFSLAGFASIYGSIMDGDPSFFLSRIYGFLALFCYAVLFVSVDKLFTKMNSLGFYSKVKRRKKFLVAIISAIFLMEVIDTILRPVFFNFFTNRGRSESWYVSNFNRPLTWVILVLLVCAIVFISYELYILGNDWLEIDNKINQKYFELPPKTFTDKFRKNNFMFLISFSTSIFLSLYYVIGYLIIYRTSDYLHEQLGFSIGPFVGIAVVVTIFYMIKLSFNYQKISHLSRETSSYGIIISILIILSPFILSAGFFFNVVFDITDLELYLTSRILLIIGVLLFTVGTYFVYKVIVKLKNEKDSEKSLKKKIKDMILPLSGLVISLIILVDTITRALIWRTYDYSGDWSERRQAWEGYVRDTLWLGYVFAILYTIALIGTIYGLIKTKKEILDFLPNYGKIPVRRRKAKVVVQPTVLIKPEEEEVEVVKKPFKPKVGHCSNCGEKIEAGFRFCPSCGTQETGKEAVPKADFCANCGEKLDKRFRFCPTCGIQIA